MSKKLAVCFVAFTVFVICVFIFVESPEGEKHMKSVTLQVEELEPRLDPASLTNGYPIDSMNQNGVNSINMNGYPINAMNQNAFPTSVNAVNMNAAAPIK